MKYKEKSLVFIPEIMGEEEASNLQLSSTSITLTKVLRLSVPA